MQKNRTANHAIDSANHTTYFKSVSWGGAF